ncbi:unnamed protein product [Rotaria magnacalcarata]|uniref:Uncharacterized protein n=3 Tax=Rotaria magnacalcarata TaxID=392030 RepID=A0A815SPK8_9BILA|nr:unnamed protein product [Rotaria magnacalcarata]CAF1537713.1 unnamed protein product [Rotaria magnacalcarata]CAF3840638.1 unnamed protein product [Rotaria magnacalcarata]
MQRHEQVIQLSDHVKNKLKSYGYSPISASLINKSDECIDSNDDNNSVFLSPPETANRERSDICTTYEMTQPSGLLFTDKKISNNGNVSVLQENYRKQKECQECIRRYHKLLFERQQTIRLYEENKKLNEQLRLSVLLNHQYKEDIQQLKYYLRKMNSHLCDYQINFNQLQQKIVSQKTINLKINEEKKVEIDDDEQDMTIDHLKRLQYEIQMYNRLVAAKQEQEEKRLQNQIGFFL